VPYPAISKFNDQVQRIQILQKTCDDKDEKIARLEQQIEEMKSSAQSRELTAQVEIPSGIHNGEKGMAGLCWLIASIQVIFGLRVFMQSIYQAWRETKQSNKPSDNLLSTSLIDIWLALGYQGGKAAKKDQKLLLLRSFRDKLVCRNRTIDIATEGFNLGRKFSTLTKKEKDGTQLDAGEAYENIIDALKKEFGKHGCFNLLTWERTPPPPSSIDATFREKFVSISPYFYKSGQTTIYDLLDGAISDCGSFCGEPSKYLVISYSTHEDKCTDFDLEQPKLLSMEKYFPSSTNTSYKLIGLLSHCGENTSDGHNLAYRLIDGNWYYFNDDEVREITETEIGTAYGLSEGGSETAYLVFFEQV